MKTYCLTKGDKTIFVFSLMLFVLGIAIVVVGFMKIELVIDAFYGNVDAPDNWALGFELLGTLCLMFWISSFVLLFYGLFRIMKKSRS